MSRPLVIAHRGARRAAPENTLAAFRAARTLGADGVELDVRATADGALVVHHDPAPLDGVPIYTRDLTALRQDHPHIPTLEEALDAANGLLVNVEIKNLPWEPDFDVTERLAVDVVELLAGRNTLDDVLVSSFHLPTVDRVRAQRASIPTALLFIGGADTNTMIDLIAGGGHAGLHPELGVLAAGDSSAVVDRAHERGLRVNVWTVNDPAEITRLGRLGVDGIITDVPDVALEVLDQ